MRAEDIKPNKLYYVKERNFDAFLNQNSSSNGIPKEYLIHWKIPSKLGIYGFNSGRVRIGHNTSKPVWWYGDRDLLFVEEYIKVVQEELDI